MNRFLLPIFFLTLLETASVFLKNESVPLTSTDFGYAPRRRLGDPRDAIDVREKKPVWMLHESSD
jgi:hypothetical protein